MKNVILMTLLALVCVGHSYAETTKVVFHIDQKEKGTFMINSVNNYITAHPDTKVVIVVNGSGVLRLIKNGGLTDELQSLINRGVEIGACNNAILSNDVDARFILPGVTFLQEGGVSKIIELQKAGYLYIKI